MRSVIQRVSKASVEVSETVVGSITSGLVVFLSVAPTDTATTVGQFVDKLLGLAIFASADGKMSLSLQDVKDSVLLISQFTLHANLQKGKRPSFSHAARPEYAQKVYERVRDALRERGVHVQTGQFGAHMHVQLCNDGPVTLLLNVGED